MTLKPPADAEFKRFIALGQKIARRMRLSGVEMTFQVQFGPVKKLHGRATTTLRRAEGQK